MHISSIRNLMQNQLNLEAIQNIATAYSGLSLLFINNNSVYYFYRENYRTQVN